jgi:pimeloyl-ACP methyl ester carboxylesterase
MLPRRGPAAARPAQPRPATPKDRMKPMNTRTSSHSLATRHHADARRRPHTPDRARTRRDHPSTRSATGSDAWTKALVAAGVLAVTALVNHALARQAERQNPPAGTFIELDGVHLHVTERGQGEPLVLLHGNGSMVQDFETSGVIDLLARTHRVIVFDRPGFGHSTRPRGRVWTAEAQADLIHKALHHIGVSRAIVLGHSWGASVAVALGLRHPGMVSSLVLAAGYYFPTARADAAIMGTKAIPVLGDVMRYTVDPIKGRLMWPLVLRKLFGPAPVPEKFSAFPREMVMRPSQLRAAGEEAALMIPMAADAEDSYADLRMPVVILSGAEDRLVDPEGQSARLHRTIPHSTFISVPGSGHMVHQTNPEMVVAAVDKARTLAEGTRPPA